MSLFRISAAFGVLLFACVAVSGSSSRAARASTSLIPEFIQQGRDQRDWLRLEQEVTFDVDGLRVCRRLRNQLQRDVIVAPVKATDNSYDEFTTYKLDLRGAILNDMSKGHGMFVLPPLPPPPGQKAIVPTFLRLKPNEAAQNCIKVDFLIGRAKRTKFIVLSVYHTMLIPETAPAEETGNPQLILMGQYGFVVSNYCYVDVSHRKSICPNQ